jgi:ceramide glucosyltransferase
VNEFWDVKRFLNRHTRWGKLRWRIGGFRYFSEFLANPVFVAAIPVIASGPSKITLSFAGLISLVKIAGDVIIGRSIRMPKEEAFSHKQSALSYLLVPMKDLIIGLVWFVPLISATVVWRGNRYLIGHDSRLSPCPESGFWSGAAG